MEGEDILRWFGENLRGDIPLEIPDEIFQALSPDLAREIARRYGSYGLVRLPPDEQQFFEWVQQHDPRVWEDLWGGQGEPYVVSLAFLEVLLGGNKRRRGFPICDLVNTDNYYFFPAMLEWTAEARDYTEAVTSRFAAGEKLSIEQLLVLEIALGGALDIWRFAYLYGIPLEQAKGAVATLVDDKVLVHLRTAEQLAPFVR